MVITLYKVQVFVILMILRGFGQGIKGMKWMIQSDKNGLFAIQQVADMTGLSKQVIRKWEERYGIIQPKRLENGYRIYSQQDVKTLLKIKLLSEQGHSLKQAALLVKEFAEDPEVPIQEGKIP